MKHRNSCGMEFATHSGIRRCSRHISVPAATILFTVMTVLSTTSSLQAQQEMRNRYGSIAIGDQITPVTVLVWIDMRSDTAVYAQKIDNANGLPQWTPYDGVPVCTAEGYKRNPVAVYDTMGGVIIGWEDFRNRRNAPKVDSTASEIYAQRLLLSDGSMDATWISGGNTGGVAVCAGTDAIARDLRMVGTPDGAFFTWTDYRNSTGYPFYHDRDVYVQYLLSRTASWPSGGSWARNGIPVSTDEADQQHPDIALDFTRTGGADRYGALIVYEDNRVDWYQIYSNNVLADGSDNWGADLRLAESQTYQYNPRIASSGTITDGIAANGALVVWEDYRGTDQVDIDIYGQGIDELGVPFWPSGGPPYTGIAICTAPDDQTRPRVAAYDDLGIAVWEDDRDEATNGTDIYANLVFLTSGATHEPAGSAIAIADLGAEQVRPEVDFTTGGSAMYMCWEDYRFESTNDADVYAQGIYNQPGYGFRWNAGGQPVSDALEDQVLPRIAGEVIGWQDSRRTALTGDARTDDDIYAETFGNECDLPTDMHWRDVFVKHTATNEATAHRAATDAEGNQYVVWLEDRGTAGGSAVYIQKLDRDGVPRWTNNGVLISDPDEAAEVPDVCPDGAGGAYICWVESGSTVKLTRVTPTGSIAGTADVAADGSEPRVVENRTLTSSSGCIVAYIDGGADVTVDKYSSALQYQSGETDVVGNPLSDLKLATTYESGAWYAVNDDGDLRVGLLAGGTLTYRTFNQAANAFDIITDRFRYLNTGVKDPTHPQQFDLMVVATDGVSGVNVARIAVNGGALTDLGGWVAVHSGSDEYFNPTITIDSVKQYTGQQYDELGGALVAWPRKYTFPLTLEERYAVNTDRVTWDYQTAVPSEWWSTDPELDDDLEIVPHVSIGMQPNGYMEEPLTERHGIVVWETDRQLGCSVSDQSLSAARVNYSVANNPPGSEPREWGSYGMELSPGLGFATQSLPLALTPEHGSEMRGVPMFWADERPGSVCLAATIPYDVGGAITWEKAPAEETATVQPADLTLSPAWPNPLREGSSCTVTFTSGEQARPLRLELCDMLGRSRMLLFERPAGRETVTLRFNPATAGLSAGMYRLLLHDGRQVVSRPLLILK